jgi:hypothetical protein
MAVALRRRQVDIVAVSRKTWRDDRVTRVIATHTATKLSSHQIDDNREDITVGRQMSGAVQFVRTAANTTRVKEPGGEEIAELRRYR